MKVRLTVGMAMIAVVTVGLWQLKAWTERASVPKEYSATERSAKMATWIAETKEPVNYDQQALLAEKLKDIFNRHLAAVQTLQSLNYEMAKENAALKKRIDELTNPRPEDFEKWASGGKSYKIMPASLFTP